MDKDQVFDVRPAGKPGAGGKAAAGPRDVKAWVRQHRTQVMAAGAGGVVLLALVARRRATTSAGSAAPGATRVVPPGSSYGDPQDFQGAAGAGVYDSTASDVYNSLQPQIEQVQRSIEALAGLQPGVPVEPVVSIAEPAPKPAPAPTSPTSTFQPVAAAPAPAPVAAAPAAAVPRFQAPAAAPAPAPAPRSIIERIFPPRQPVAPPAPAYVPPPLAPARTYRLDNPYRPPSHTNPILRPGDAPSPGNAPRPGGTLAQIAASQAQYMPGAPAPARAQRGIERMDPKVVALLRSRKLGRAR